ncbi:enoyl-CoA hydratase-related protein [Aestuariirhabdus sp. Z084]|nr:enoyl-CoA hydratase-related protein [Aestuariirhabdus haliotis]MCL6418642.1 enoyl-CoA hydratase-related protein [Aestuariirhabdus haliotis]
MSFPEFDSIRLELNEHCLQVWLNRPKSRNAMSLQMVKELMALFEILEDQSEIRTLLLRGSEGNFCSGGDIKDMAAARAASASQKSQDIESSDISNDPFYQLNREFGHMITRANRLPVVVVAVLEGAVLGGGFGLACISDVAIAVDGVQFGLPETGLGIPPAQIAPFVLKRIGLTQARRLMLLGSRFGAEEAHELGLVHYQTNPDRLDELLSSILSQIKRCAPGANATTKAILLAAETMEHEALLDFAAGRFADSIYSAEGSEGTLAFVQKRKAAWAE